MVIVLIRMAIDDERATLRGVGLRGSCTVRRLHISIAAKGDCGSQCQSGIRWITLFQCGHYDNEWHTRCRAGLRVGNYVSVSSR